MLLIGAVFAWGGLTIDPATNCSEGGECAPYLVPIAAVLGILAMLGGLARLLANPSRGSRLNLATGTLEWWQERTVGQQGDTGRIQANQIGLIRICKDSESSDEIHLYDLAGERQAYFDSQVVPWRVEEWTGRLAKAWPHIRVEVVG